VDEFPFDHDVGEVGAAAWFEGDVVVEASFDDRDDLDWRWVWARGVDLAAVAEGFEVGDFAGGVEGGQFGQGFWEGNVPGVDHLGSADWGLRIFDLL
jgi:hypothetical protein